MNITVLSAQKSKKNIMTVGDQRAPKVRRVTKERKTINQSPLQTLRNSNISARESYSGASQGSGVLAVAMELDPNDVFKDDEDDPENEVLRFLLLFALLFVSAGVGE